MNTAHGHPVADARMGFRVVISGVDIDKSQPAMTVTPLQKPNLTHT